jgi:histidinol-phosphate phosphatase family protein
MDSFEWNIDQTWTLFLDRDGVINDRIMNDHVTKVADFHFKDNVLESIASLTSKFNHVFVVTNQQGVALGKMTQHELDEIHQHMITEINRVGGHITHVFSATELRNTDSEMRKPSPKMALMAKEQFFEVQFEKSIMVGDTDTDIQFGQRLGMKTVLILTEEKIKEKADVEVKSLMELNLLIQTEL